MVEAAFSLVATLSVIAWLYLVLFRGAFWRSDQFLPDAPISDLDWPGIVAVIPARNEADTIADAITSHLAQDYPGAYRIILVNDQSTDATRQLAADAAGANPALNIIEGTTPLERWTGKLWAVQQGLNAIDHLSPNAKYILFTDADISHSKDNLRKLVIKAEHENLVLVSQMVMLRCVSFWERLLIPAFVFFFQMLYPFRWVSDPNSKIAAAAGGCMLVNRKTLIEAGGIETIRDQVIDDCALARLLKPFGPVWLGLCRETVSLRAYEFLSEIWSMVARTAFVQLRYSLLLLAGTIISMFLIYLLPPIAAVFGLVMESQAVLVIGCISWILMSICYVPTLRLYRQPAWTSVFMPISALVFTLMTIDSARKFLIGIPPSWRGRQTLSSPAPETDQ